jgi:hypothetical protein
MERALAGSLRKYRKPVLFSDICTAEDPPAFVRSVRRALQSLIRKEVVIALGKGGRADPHRYCLHPVVAANMYNSKELRAFIATIKDELPK